MGALHEGHLSLIREAARENTDVFDSDVKKLEKLNEELGNLGAGTGRITAIFAPTSKVVYPTMPPSSEIDGHGSFVNISPLARNLEGVSRPVFFRGVATICMKLFNVTTPDRVYFGQKDVQQSVIVKRIVKDFLVDTEVRIIATAREPDGLALGSRNVYLGARRRIVGLTLHKALSAAAEAYKAGRTSRDDVLGASLNVAERVLSKQQSLPPSKRALYKVDYISLADSESLEELDLVDPKKGAVLSTAFKMAPLEETEPGEDCGLGDGKVPVRLIDNMILQPQA
ncbi:Pantothenate synthetase [Penicillium macrosclerotiorum]|uniref:Pantothenate synthetase n=1 Tax=Penicillium macrosclerotiorum TaxID=303699 RepID=UPI002546FA04|nr:Pantothenate synthetase [Penicillium macrosclerotiorum]KAJ5666555.1 Pantothenate synthetase [Penicillium macrosclerotiorum]